MEAVHVPAHLAPPGCPQFKQLRHLHAQPSLGQGCHSTTSLVSMPPGLLQSCPTLCDPVDCGLPGFSVREGGSPGNNTRVYWPVLVAIPSRALYFLLPQLPAPLRTWCCRNPCDPSSCMTSSPGPQGANPSPPGQPQEQTPGDGPHAEVGIKPQVKPRGGVAKEEDPTPPHQPQVKSTRSTGQTLCLSEI